MDLIEILSWIQFICIANLYIIHYINKLYIMHMIIHFINYTNDHN